MKLKLAFGFLPYLLFKVDEISRTVNAITVGRTLGFVVLLDEDKAHPSVVPHEEVHVAFFYIMLALVFGSMTLAGLEWYFGLYCGLLADKLFGVVKPYRVFEESFGYAREAAHRPDPEAYIDSLAHSRHHLDKYGEDFPSKVRKRYNRWFS